MQSPTVNSQTNRRLGDIRNNAFQMMNTTGIKENEKMEYNVPCIRLIEFEREAVMLDDSGQEGGSEGGSGGWG